LFLAALARRAQRRERRLPRWIVVADGDNALPIDLDNILSVESFAHLVKVSSQEWTSSRSVQHGSVRSSQSSVRENARAC
jgi:hypothetical protein